MKMRQLTDRSNISKPTKHPKIVARSPTMAVKTPIIPRATKKDNHPPQMLGGGQQANMI